MSPRSHACWPARCAIGLIVLLVAACSMVSLGYQHAPSLLTWRAAEYFDLDSTQRERFRARLERVHAWHRAEQLGSLLGILEDAQQRLARPLAADDGEWLVDTLLAHYRLVVGRIIDESADLLTTLSPAQIVALEQRLDERAAEYAATWIKAPPEDVRRARYQRIRAHIEDWLGRLEPRQRAWLHARLAEIPADYAAWHADRSRRDAQFIALLKSVAGEAEAPRPHPAVRRWALDWHEQRTAALRIHADEVRRAYVALGVELINNATPAQRDHLRNKLADYAIALDEHIP
jgi:hypothetical protein